MSISKEQLCDYARALSNHDAHEEIQRRIDKRLFERFITATDEERRVIADLVNASRLYQKELKLLVDEIKDDKSIN